MKRKTIAACLIVKNEEVLLERCLNSIKGVDSIWILDTGSKDATVSIARKFTDNVFLDYVWTDSFSDAQNYLLGKVRGKADWILSVDADEQLLTGIESCYEAIEQAENVVRCTMVAEGGVKNEYGFGRLFRNTPEIYWEQAIHKHLNVPGEGEPVGNVRIMYGYSPAHELDPDRSLRMLEKAVASEKDPVRNLYYLGREYWYKKRYQDCIDTLTRYTKVAHWMAELADACLIMAHAYASLGKAEACAMSALRAILINPNFKEAIEFMASISIDENKKRWKQIAMTASNEGVLWVRTQREPNLNTILISPHNDDESLYCAYTLLRERPLVVVVTDSFIQPERGEVGCDAETRRNETIEAMKIAGCPVVFLGIRDTELDAEILRERLKVFNPDKVYAPAVQGGNGQHDIVGIVAKELFGDRVEQYCTYTKTELYTTGSKEIKPTEEEMQAKLEMLYCYNSQWRLPSTKVHFEAVMPRSIRMKAVSAKSEWLL